MRGFICTIVLVILLLTGFLLTPSPLKLINPDYQLALSENRARLEGSSSQLATLRDRIILQSVKVEELEKLRSQLDFARNQEERSGTSAGMPTAAGRGPEWARLNNEFRATTAELDKERSNLKILDAQKKALEGAYAEIMEGVEKKASESYNLYLVTRALALGAIGALMSIFAGFVATKQATELFDHISLTRIWTSMIMGSIVAVVVLGLFHTRQISIFPHSDTPSGATAAAPDFWRVTILCLLAGAFSERLFQAAAGRVSHYLGESAKESASARHRDGNKRKELVRGLEAPAQPTGERAKPTLVDIETVAEKTSAKPESASRS